MKRKAFTLIELLVIVAIVAILLAIIYPVVAHKNHHLVSHANTVRGVDDNGQPCYVPMNQ